MDRWVVFGLLLCSLMGTVTGRYGGIGTHVRDRNKDIPGSEDGARSNSARAKNDRLDQKTSMTSQELHADINPLHTPWDFYTAQSNQQTAPTGNGAVPEITDQLQTTEPDLCRQDGASAGSSVYRQLMCIIHKPEFQRKYFQLVGRDYSIYVQSHLEEESSVLEIGNGVTALTLSKYNHSVGALIYPEFQMAEKVFLAKRKKIHLMTSSLSKLLTSIEGFQPDPQVLFHTILVSNISTLVSNHLPHELQLLLSKVFSLAHQTFVAFDVSNNHKMESFFSFWDHPKHLLDSCCTYGHLSCSVRRVAGPPSIAHTWDGSLWKITVSRSVRKMPASVCNGHQECKLVYKHHNDSTEQILQAMNWKSIVTIPSYGIPLHVLLQLGLNMQSRELMMTQLLEANMDMSGVTARDVCVSRHSIHRISKLTKVLETEKVKEKQHEAKLLNQILHISIPHTSLLPINQLAHQQSEILGLLEPPVSQMEPPAQGHEKNIYPSAEFDQDNARDTFLKKEKADDVHLKVSPQSAMDSKVKRSYPRLMNDRGDIEQRIEIDADMATIKQETNQEDGVAHMWQREMGVLNDVDREKFKKGALVKMSEQWDRENHQDHVVSVMSDQYKWAAIDKLWTRDEGDDIDMGVANKGGHHEGHVYKYDQELGKMIGSLNDNDNQVDIELRKVKGHISGVVRTKGDSQNNSPSKLKFDTTTYLGGRKEDTRTGAVGNNTNIVQLKKQLQSVDFKTKSPAVQETRTNMQTIASRTNAKPVRQTGDLEITNQLQETSLTSKNNVNKQRRSNRLQEILTKNEPKMTAENQLRADKMRQKQQQLNKHRLEYNQRHAFSQAKPAKRHLLNEDVSKEFYTNPPVAQDTDRAPHEEEELKEDAEFLAPVSDEIADDDQTDGDIENEESVGCKLDRKSLYSAEWSQLKGFFQQLKADEPFSLLTYGLEQQSSLSAKICWSFPSASVVTILPESNEELVQHHRKLQDSLELKNNLLVNSDLPDRVVLELYHLPEMFKFQILGLSVFSKATSLGSHFLLYLGRLLSLAETTFLEVPPPHTLALATVLLRNTSCDDTHPVFKGFIYTALQSAGFHKVKIDLLDNQMPNDIKLLKIQLLEGRKEIIPGCVPTKRWLHIHENQPTTLSNSAAPSKQGYPLDRATKAITLKTLLTLGLPTLERKQLFFSYFSTGLHTNMCPVNMVWMQGRLVYNKVYDKLSSHVTSEQWKQSTVMGLMGLLNSQIDSEPFSFLEYGSGKGSLSLALAAKYTNSSIVSMTEDMSDAESHLAEVKRLGLWNNVITVSKLDDSFSNKLVESPDFLRYQFLGLYQYLLLLQEQGGTSSDTLATCMGNLLSSAVTTFIQLPSAQVLSLAVATFFLEILNGTKFVHMTQQDKFLRANHPLDPYRNAEIHLIKEGSFGPSVNVNVSSHVLHPADDSLTWSLLRVDVRKLNITVNHHFDFSLDGHKRKYTLYCNSNKTDYEVYLIRDSDGFRIPYGKISGISLIALLRMGLLKDLKERLYNVFLHLPLYEDMAPWNIVFQGGSLQYIDYDTKGVKLDKFAPMAYQVMALLLNYERTVKDFGHCSFNAGNQYGIAYVSHCVGSHYKGPCQDIRFPVPCADRTCKATYIDCLRAMSEMELSLTATLQGSSKTDAGMMEVEDTSITSDYNLVKEEEDWQLTPKKSPR